MDSVAIKTETPSIFENYETYTEIEKITIFS